MNSFDKVAIGYLIFLFLLPLIGFAARFLRSDKTQRFSLSFWLSWGNGIVITLMVLVSHYISFYHAHPVLVVSVIVGWVAVLLWNSWRIREKTKEKEMITGQVPKTYNDWAKPDKP